jgi:hypothetical protein
MVLALHDTNGIRVVSECLYNKAIFDPEEVATAVLYHFHRYRTFVGHRTEERIVIVTSRYSDFLELCSDSFLMTLLVKALTESEGLAADHYANMVIALVLNVLRRRGARIDDRQAWRSALRNFRNPTFVIEVSPESNEPAVQFAIGKVFSTRSMQ